MRRRELAPGENAPLPQVWRLTVSPDVPLSMVSLDAADHVHGEPIAVMAQALSLNLGSLDAAVNRCLLVAHGRDLPDVGCDLELGEQTLTFRSGVPGTALAMVLLEFYRRGGGWKVRALGHIYAGGLPELGRVHGAVLTDPAVPAANVSEVDCSAANVARSAALVSEAGGSVSAASDTGEPERLVRHLNGIWEDASRSLVAYAESMAFADRRRDDELGALLGDPAGRSDDHPQRATIEARHQQVADTASRRRLSDLDQLLAELTALEQDFPAPVARWDSQVWRQPIGPDGAGIFRIGTLSRQDSRALRIPMVHGVSVLGGICLENPAGIVEQVTIGLLHRVLAAVPAGTGVSVIADDDQLAGFLGLPASTGSGPQRLTELARQVDLHQMAAEAGVSADLPGRLPGVLILPWPTLGFADEQVPALDRIGTDGALLGIRTIYLASRSQLGALPLRRQPRYLPVVPASVTDPWTGLVWDFEPDDGAADATVVRRITERAGRCG